MHEVPSKRLDRRSDLPPMVHEGRSLGRRGSAMTPDRTEALRTLRQFIMLIPNETDQQTARAALEAVQEPYVGCPDAEACKHCPCSFEDDVCFPGERLREELRIAQFDASVAQTEREEYHLAKTMELRAKLETATAQLEAVKRTLLNVGAPTHEESTGFRLNANGMLVDWLAGKRAPDWVGPDPLLAMNIRIKP